MISIRQLIDFFFYGRHRLETVKKLPLGSSIAEAIALYGEPIETEPSEETPEITQYTFAAGDYHEVVASEWKGTIQSITYWSIKADPERDLACMLEKYSESKEWELLEEGYWYQRQDEAVRLWCSAIPAIGVAFINFLEATTDLKTAHNLSKLNDLEEITWVPNDVVHELQRMRVEEGSDALMKFCERSDSIAVSPDGKCILIIRDHHAYDVDSGFMEMNIPPKLENGYASPVVNIFTWSPDGSSWGKITLPRDAKVDRICFEGDRCIIEIHQSAGDRRLKYNRPFSEIRRLCRLTSSPAPHTDLGLWEVLEKAESESAIIGDHPS